METKDMLIEDIEKRSLEIEEELKKEDADVDSLEAEVKELKCVDCGETIVDTKKKDGSQWKAVDIAAYSTRNFGRCLCPACQRKAYDASKGEGK